MRASPEPRESPVPIPIVGRARAYPDPVRWLEGLRDVADAKGHGEAYRYAGMLLALVDAAHETVDAGYPVSPDLVVALLGIPRR